MWLCSSIALYVALDSNAYNWKYSCRNSLHVNVTLYGRSTVCFSKIWRSGLLLGNALYVTLLVHKLPLPLPPPPQDDVNLTSHPLRSFVGHV